MDTSAGGKVPAAMMAKLLDVSERRLQQLRKEGVIPGAGRGQYDLVGTVQGYVKYLREANQRGSQEFEGAKVRKMNADARKSEIELAKLEGESVAVHLVLELWGKIVTEVRTNLLAIPTKVAPKLNDTLSTAQKADLISDEVNKALDGFSRTEVIPEAPQKT